MEQLMLFDEAEAIDALHKPGAIVRQTWPWIGCFDRIYPYWQVRFSRTEEGLLLDRIHSDHPSWNDTKVRKESRRLREESDQQRRAVRATFDADAWWQERHYYCTAVPYGTFPSEIHWFGEKDIAPTGLSWKVPSWHELEEWCRANHNTNTFLAHLNGPHRGLSDRGAECLPPYREEAELVAMLRGLGVDWQAVSRENFDSLFHNHSLPAVGRTFSAPTKPGQVSLFV